MTTALQLLLLSISILLLNGEHSMSCTYSRNRKHKLVAHCENQRFTSVPMNLSREIDELILSNNLIRVLTNNSFFNYSKMESLILSKSNISEIQEDAFAGLKSLKVLKVNDNFINIKILTKKVFSHLSNLIVLNISRNKKPFYPNSPFIYPDVTLSTLEHLRNLSIDLFMFPVFGTGFTSLQNLTSLNFEQCYLYNSSGFKLMNSTFKNFSPNLKELYIRGCHHFFLIEDGLLEYFPNLKILDLSESYVHLYQAMRILHPYQDKNMSGLNFHHITDSSINGNDFPYSVFITVALMKYLRTICIDSLDLSKTGIVDYQQNSLFSFEHPECFNTFIISANRLPSTTADHYIEAITFARNAVNMKVYDFSYLTADYSHPAYLNVYDPEAFYHFSKRTQKIEVHPKIKFSLPSSIEFLRFSYMVSTLNSASVTCANTSLTYLDVSFSVYHYFPDLTNDCGKQLEYLDVSGIPVTVVTFPSILLPKLSTLKMTNARIDQAVLKGKQWIFFIAPEIRKIDISFNNLWTLEESTFLGQPNITHLNMSNNLLRTIPTFVTRLEKLESLDLSGNLITSIDGKIRLWMDKMILSNRSLLLNLNNNALVCSCDTLGFLLWFAQTKVTFYNGDTYNCTMSNDKQAVLREVIQNTKKNFSDCKSTMWLHVGIVLVASTFCILIPLIVIYNYRWKIILYIYRKVRRVVEKDLHENFMYDAYFSYEERSVTWIKKFLLPKIEGEWGLKVCLHDRDLLPGDITADAKAESIQQSRHFVFIITEYFTKGKWGRFEID
ncbi:toll-like receptor 2 [Mytilus californianus]|uniref:toll-like receptor 2 n=1 Tax=Mytilus californianus TaxID=6549 RepID=UPI002245AA99|nr:toll-like receptor 2 [Mytilus californianus]